ncbi:MAG: histidine phosphatase family protein [Clostridia bacterium]|nr:histidine phosphatase family protein [Clostridia bacterium]MBR2412943.1 histidine phosphatase family protein [Clostridia bacterium]MBR3955626.1 histidine phosphatase family protein [Clostridia bacterium]
MLLYIIRHGEPGHDGALTELGQKQALAVGERMGKCGIDRIFSSPLLRAKQTAQPACDKLGLEMTIEEWAAEIGDGRLTTLPDGSKKSVSLLQNTLFLTGENANLPFSRAYECDFFNTSGMQEAVSFIEENGNAFLEKLGYKKEGNVYRIVKPSDEKVALFCHAAFSRAWISVLLHIPVHIMWAGFDYEHSGVTVLEFENNENGITAPTCLRYSDTSHLYAAELEPLVHIKKEM